MDTINNSNNFEFPPFELPRQEYGKIIHEINTNYSKYKGKKLAIHRSLDLQGNYCVYFFENHGYGNYNIFGKHFD